MKSQRLNANVTVWPMLSIVIFLLMCLTFLPTLSVAAAEDPSQEIQEVELYQDDSGEWKVRYVNAGTGEPAAAPSQEPVITTTKAEQEPTEVELYQDDSGEWKVRYTTESQAPVQDEAAVAKSEPAPAKETAKLKDETPAAPAIADVSAKEEKVASADTAKAELTPKAEEKPVAKAVEEVKTEVAKVVAEAKAENEEMNKSIQEAVQNARTIPMDKTELAAPKAAASKPHSKKAKVPESMLVKDSAPVVMEEPYYRNPNHRFEVGASVAQHHFEQDTIVNNTGFETAKRNEGKLYGLHAGYEYILADKNAPKYSIHDVVRNIEAVDRYIITLDYQTGSLKNKDIAADSPEEEFTNHIMEGRAIAGYDIKINKSNRITPFLGVGYRYQTDPSGGNIDSPESTIVDGRDNVDYNPVDGFNLFQKYDIDTHYLYIPIGLMTNSDITDSLSVRVSLEMDILLWGMIKSKLSQVGPLYEEELDPNDPDPPPAKTKSLRDITNNLRGGFGFRGSTRVVKKQRKIDFYVEPYIKYWRINESAEEQYPLIRSDGLQTILFHDLEHTIPYTKKEPRSTTTEYGIQAGIEF